jgi:serine protease Do
MIKRLLFAFWLALLASVALAQTGRELPDFTDLADRQGPSVVNISSSQVMKGPRFNNHPFPLDEDDPSFEFFRRFMPKQFPGMPRDFRAESLGSGFIVSADGYILTNAHVVDGADEVLVKLTDKREFKAKVIGTDRRTDVALIKIDASGLPAVRLGDPSRLRVGEWVVAIGSPFGFENSLTAGIVSAKGRSLPQESYVPFIQTDVAINPGNSGGPLFNMRGEVVGMNSQIYSRSGGYMGLSFAIPIDVAMDVQSQLRSGGKVSRGRIGVMIQEVTRDLADSFGLGKPQGALVAFVEKGSPAEKAGIEAGDVILKFDGKVVGQSSDLPRMVGATKPGTRAPVQVWRKGATRDLTVSIAEITDEKGSGPSRRGSRGADAPAPNKLGLVLGETTAEQRKQLGIAGGVVIEDVRTSGGRGDLRSGDIVLAVVAKGMQTEVRNVEHFNSLLNGLDKGASMTLLVRRGDAQTFITLKGSGGDR